MQSNNRDMVPLQVTLSENITCQPVLLQAAWKA